jgi:hypothetical protein
MALLIEKGEQDVYKFCKKFIFTVKIIIEDHKNEPKDMQKPPHPHPHLEQKI